MSLKIDVDASLIEVAAIKRKVAGDLQALTAKYDQVQSSFTVSEGAYADQFRQQLQVEQKLLQATVNLYDKITCLLEAAIQTYQETDQNVTKILRDGA